MQKLAQLRAIITFDTLPKVSYPTLNGYKRHDDIALVCQKGFRPHAGRRLRQTRDALEAGTD